MAADAIYRLSMHAFAASVTFSDRTDSRSLSPLDEVEVAKIEIAFHDQAPGYTSEGRAVRPTLRIVLSLITRHSSSMTKVQFTLRYYWY
jgi:hypothetical protein